MPCQCHDDLDGEVLKPRQACPRVQPLDNYAQRADAASTTQPPPHPTANLSDPPPTSSTKPTRSQSAKDQQAEAACFKKKFIATSTQLIEDAASFDELAHVFGNVLQWTEGNKTISVEFGKVLRANQERLVNHLTIVRESETTTSFSSLLLQSVSPALKQISEQSAAQHKVIASLAKELENVKKPHVSYAAALATAATSLPRAVPVPKPRPPPLPPPAEERLLVRFDGDTPPILAAPYPEILRLANAHLQSLSLPLLLYAQKQNASSLFIVPASTADVDVLIAEWNRWSPGVFPGARIAPVATHFHLQVYGLLFSNVGDLKDLKREFELKNPGLGKVIGLPTWVNRPPSESQIAAIISSGRKPKDAGSVYFLLESKAKVDLALSRGRILLCSFSPLVSRGFPHLRVSQCRKCYRFPLTRGLQYRTYDASKRARSSLVTAYQLTRRVSNALVEAHRALVRGVNIL
ncbi:hypothetical protein DFH09DRAFT_1433254 [Mycena vulgaris]|nr:hypothetical protein DFH09DRAFT_1433254 [Mycena vulgaris]